jgi:hypothetical protein
MYSEAESSLIPLIPMSEFAGSEIVLEFGCEVSNGAELFRLFLLVPSQRMAVKYVVGTGESKERADQEAIRG